MFLFALPAGALADMVDKRRFILVLEILTTVFSALFATLVAWQAVTPTVLLVFVFLLGSLAAIETPAWQSIVPPTGAASGPVLRDSNQQRRGQRQPRPRARASPASSSWDWASRAPFWVDAFSNLGVIAVILWWRSDTRPTPALPPGNTWAVQSGGAAGAMHATTVTCAPRLPRAVGFFPVRERLLGAAASGGTQPVTRRPHALRRTARSDRRGRSGWSIPAATDFKARSDANALVVVGQCGTALALLLFGLTNTAAVTMLRVASSQGSRGFWCSRR